MAKPKEKPSCRLPMGWTDSVDRKLNTILVELSRKGYIGEELERAVNAVAVAAKKIDDKVKDT